MPHAIPQTHSSFYPHRSWTLLWLASTQSTFLKLFRCSRFSELDSKQIQENFILSHFLSLLERANTNYIVKFNLRSGKEEAQIRISDYAPRKITYGWGGYSGVDLAVDENGLWVLWGNTRNNHRLHASKINVQKNSISQTWSLDTGMTTINRFLRKTNR